MDGRAFLQLLRTRWTTVATCLMLGLIVGTGVALLTPIKFASTAQVLLRTPGWNAITSGDIANASPYQADDYSQERARTYASLVSAPGFAERLHASSRLQRSASDFAGDLTARVVPDTVLLEVTAKDRTATGAQELTTAAAAELVKEIRQLETPDGALVSTVEPVLTSPATAPKDATDPDVAFMVTMGGAFGFLAGVTVATLMNTRRRSPTAINTSQGSSA